MKNTTKEILNEIENTCVKSIFVLLQKLAKQYPNDYDLGEEVRRLAIETVIDHH